MTVIMFFLYMTVGMWILDGAMGIVDAWGNQLDSDPARGTLRQEFNALPPRKRLAYLLLFMLISFVGAMSLFGLIMGLAREYFPYVDSPPIAQYPEGDVAPVMVGTYMGIAILTILGRAIYAFNVTDEKGAAAKTVRDALKRMVSFDALLAALVIPTVLAFALWIGQMRTPVYSFVGDIDIAEFSGQTKTFIVVLGSLFILEFGDGLRAFAAKAVSREQQKQASEIQPGNTSG